MANAKLFVISGPETAGFLDDLAAFDDLHLCRVDGKPLEAIYREIYRYNTYERAGYKHVVLYGCQVPAGLHLGFRVTHVPVPVATIRGNYCLRATTLPARRVAEASRAYDVYRLWHLTRGLHACPIPVTEVWCVLHGQTPLAEVAVQLGSLHPGDAEYEKVQAADTRYPLLRHGRHLLDGHHRLVKLLWQGKKTVCVVDVPKAILGRCLAGRARTPAEFRQYLRRLQGL
jgi:hypothetical protein